MPRTIVIGAGAVGLTAAYELSKRGDEVLVVDRREPGAGSSSGNAGWIVPSLSAPVPAPGLTTTSIKWMLRRDSPLYIKPRLDPDFWRWLGRFWWNCREEPYRAGLDAVVNLNRRTLELFDRLRVDGIDFEMHHSGLLFVGRTLDGLLRALESVRPLVRIGYQEPALLSASEVCAVEPALSRNIAGGFLVPEERHVRPETFLRGLVHKLAELGVEIRSGVEVTGVEQSGGSVAALNTPTGPVEGDRVLLAAGAWSGEIAKRFGFHLPIESGKGYSITVDEPRQTMLRPIEFIDDRTVFTPFDGAARIAGMMELSGLNSGVDRARLDATWLAANRYFREPLAGGMTRAWTGMRPMTPDGLPVIGRMPGADNLYVATGHAMLGLTLAPVTALAIAQLIHDGSSEIELSPFDPGRFS